MTRTEAQERMYQIRDERKYLETLEASLDARQKVLLREARAMLMVYSTLSFMGRPKT